MGTTCARGVVPASRTMRLCAYATCAWSRIASDALIAGALASIAASCGCAASAGPTTSAHGATAADDEASDLL